MTSLLFCALLCLTFLPFLAVISSPGGAEDRRLRARFALLTSQGKGNLSETAVNNLLLEADRTRNPWLAAVIARVFRVFGLAQFLKQAGVKVTEGTLLAVSMLLLLLSTMIGGLACGAWWLSALGGVSTSSVPWIFVAYKRRKRLRAFDKCLPRVADMLSRAMRAGHSLPAGIRLLAEQAPEPSRQEFLEVFHQQKFGVPLREALLELLERVPSQDLSMLVTSIVVHIETGGNLASILDKTSNVVRERLKLNGDLKTQTAQAKLTGVILGLLPLGLLALLNLLNPGYSEPLWNDPIGRVCVWGGAGLLLVGVLLIRHIVRGVES